MACGGRQATWPMPRRHRRPRVASVSARRRQNAGKGRELGSGAEANAGPAYMATSGAETVFLGATVGSFGPIRLVERITRLLTAAACATGAGAGAGAGGSSPRLRIRISPITGSFSFVGDGCFRAAVFGGGERRPLAGGDATAAALETAFGAGEATAGILGTAAAALGAGEVTAAALGGGEDGFGLRRRRGFVGDGVNASRCIWLFSTSWDRSIAVAMASDDSRRRLQRGGNLRCEKAVR